MANARRTRVVAFWVLVAALIVAQQCSWFWQSDVLVLEFLPAPLFYHVCVSLAAVVVWWIGTIVAWPGDSSISARPSPPTEMSDSAEGGS